MFGKSSGYIRDFLLCFTCGQNRSVGRHSMLSHAIPNSTTFLPQPQGKLKRKILSNLIAVFGQKFITYCITYAFKNYRCRKTVVLTGMSYAF